MPYEIQLAQINAGIAGLTRSNTAWGFPADTDFHTILMSYWMCGPWQTAPGLTGSPGIWPAFASASFFNFGPGSSPFIRLTNQTLGPSGAFFTAGIPAPLPTSPLGCRLHFMMSVDTHAQIVQVYINDEPVTLTSPTWTGTAPYDFNVNDTINIWAWDVSNVIGTGIHPAFGDAWISNTPDFVDLSVTANRRKFIDRALQPVDLGADGRLPFDYQPAMYMSVRPGGVATDIQLNRGSGGGSWNFSGPTAPTFQTDGVCLVPERAFLDMDNLLVTGAPRPHGDQIFLRWSDDRGHTWSNPVGQPIGARGAYLTSVSWNRLGYARDRVFDVFWSVPVKTALQGAFVDLDPRAKS